jgi:hypothetical protein
MTAPWWQRAAVGVAVLAVLGGLSRVPYDATGDDRAMIRLSWRTPGERVSECRRPTPEELERLPVHMRREEVCEGRILPYRLRLFLDGAPVIDDTVHAPGLRQDRPLAVSREVLVPAGAYRVRVEWEGIGGSPEEQVAVRDQRTLSLEETVRLGDRQIALVTYDPDARRLVVRTRAGSGRFAWTGAGGASTAGDSSTQDGKP